MLKFSKLDISGGLLARYLNVEFLREALTVPYLDETARMPPLRSGLAGLQILALETAREKEVGFAGNVSTNSAVSA